MPDLDFTALKQLSYHGFKTEQEKDDLTEQGFTILPGEKTPFEAPEPPANTPAHPRGSPPPMQEYKRIFRAAFEFLEQHSPAGRSAEYWIKAARDAATVCNQGGNHPFLMGLVAEAYAELERQARAQDAEAKNQDLFCGLLDCTGQPNGPLSIEHNQKTEGA